MTYRFNWGSIRRPVNLRLESLDPRDLPSATSFVLGLLDTPTQPAEAGEACATFNPVSGFGGTDVAADGPKDKGPAAHDGTPELRDVTAIAGPGGLLTLTGLGVDDKSLAGCVVTIIGGGINTFAFVDDSGGFGVTVQRPSEVGFTLTCQVTDADGNKSHEFTAYVPAV